MFKIVLKNDSESWAMVDVETEERFLSENLQSNSPHLPGTRLRNEFMKTHWQRAEEWQDITGRLEVERLDGQYLGDLKYCGLNIASVIGDYRFVKVEAYVIPDGMLESTVLKIVNLNWLIPQMNRWRTTLLRVERKEDHV